MRSLLAIGLMVALCTAANAAPAQHARTRHPPHPAVDRPGADVRSGARFAVPGWSDGATERWLDSASSNVGRGG